MIAAAKKRKGIKVFPEKWICPDCGGNKKDTTVCCMSCANKRRSGKNSPHWKGGITTQQRLDRTKFVSKIGKEVMKRDNYTCQMCGEQGKYLHVDHIQPWADYVELRFDIRNCRTLCIDCHYLITWGKKRPSDSKWGIKRGMVKKEVLSVLSKST